MNKDGLFIKCEHPTPEMREKIRAGIIRHWKIRKRSAKRIAEDAQSEKISAWLRKELAKVRKP